MAAIESLTPLRFYSRCRRCWRLWRERHTVPEGHWCNRRLFVFLPDSNLCQNLQGCIEIPSGRDSHNSRRYREIPVFPHPEESQYFPGADWKQPCHWQALLRSRQAVAAGWPASVPHRSRQRPSMWGTTLFHRTHAIRRVGCRHCIRYFSFHLFQRKQTSEFCQPCGRLRHRGRLWKHKTHHGWNSSKDSLCCPPGFVQSNQQKVPRPLWTHRTSHL